MEKFWKFLLLVLVMLTGATVLILYLTCIAVPYSVLFSMQYMWPGPVKGLWIEKMEKPLRME